MNSNKFLKSLGLTGEVNHKQLDNRLLRSLNEDEKSDLRNAWVKLHNYDTTSDLYSIPKTLKQASLLFSHDYFRIKTSMEWISDLVECLKPNAIVDMGCGYGVLIRFLQLKFPDISFMGIDKKENLISIGSNLTGINLISGDYSTYDQEKSYDMIICDFGFDMEDLLLPKNAHTSTEIQGISFCSQCCRDFEEKLNPFVVSWKKWGGSSPDLVMTGRISNNPSYLLATLRAANKNGWNLNLDKTTCLKVYDPRSKRSEIFPGLLFQTSEDNQVEKNFVAISKLLKKNM